ncbi:hypothetical protein AB6A40_011137 [Gnathostoma spinigerum]|uniref:Uncharacterized protein n=1 Tax=Gnathostoma spinigerum TaxID=75299 RepID=A0ABD6EWT8_9BILA
MSASFSLPSGDRKGRRRISSANIPQCPSIPPPYGFTPMNVESLMASLRQNKQSQLYRAFTRWKHTLSLMAKIFEEQLIAGCGGEISGSILLNEFAGFSVRETQFRKRMQKYKSSQTKDLIFEVDRDRQLLIAQTLRQLNLHYTRRTTGSSSAPASSSSTSVAAAGNSGNSASRDSGIINRIGVRLGGMGNFWTGGVPNSSTGDTSTPPLAANKVKVTFKQEPGEGTGVARSFYSAVADAFQTMSYLPNENQVLAAFGASTADSTASTSASRPSARGSANRERSAFLRDIGHFPGRRRGVRRSHFLFC